LTHEPPLTDMLAIGRSWRKPESLLMQSPKLRLRCLGVLSHAREVEDHTRLVADNPPVVARW